MTGLPQWETALRICQSLHERMGKFLIVQQKLLHSKDAITLQSQKMGDHTDSLRLSQHCCAGQI